MASRLICNPAPRPAGVLLGLIQSTPDAFTEGRRNNDMVNWFIIKRLLDLEAGEDPNRSARYVQDAYIADMGWLMTKEFSDQQRQDLEGWADGWRSKILRLVQAYGDFRDPASLYNLWLPMEYSDGTHPDQTVLPGMSMSA